MTDSEKSWLNWRDLRTQIFAALLLGIGASAIALARGYFPTLTARLRVFRLGLTTPAPTSPLVVFALLLAILAVVVAAAYALGRKERKLRDLMASIDVRLASQHQVGFEKGRAEAESLRTIAQQATWKADAEVKARQGAEARLAGVAAADEAARERIAPLETKCLRAFVHYYDETQMLKTEHLVRFAQAPRIQVEAALSSLREQRIVDIAPNGLWFLTPTGLARAADLGRT